MNAPGRKKRPISIADGIFGGIVLSLFAITLYAYARRPWEGHHPLPPGAADELRIEIHDRNDDTNVDFTVPFGFVQGVASLLPDEATVRFDRSVDELDFADLWKKIEAAPDGQRVDVVQGNRKIAATRMGQIVELEIHEPRHFRSGSYAEPMPPAPPEAPAVPTVSSAATAASTVAKTGAVKPEPTTGEAAADDDDAEPEVTADSSFDEEIVHIKLPVSLLRKAAEGIDQGHAKIRLAETLRELRGLGPMELVRIEGPNESVRIALE